MIEITNKNECCGCYACMNICPKKAISMKEDEKGFKYPVIDKNKCINCKICEDVCPILNSKQNKYEQKVYAVINKNKEERMTSSSGGIFILLSKEIIKKNGIVFGAAFDKDFNVNHIYIDSEENINLLQGSKYVQSNINETYKKAKEFLDLDKYVLFTGTSCQIEGLKSFLRKDYEKLYTQDIICHGVPSPKVWKKYLDYQKEKNKEKINDISFRNKEHSWSLYEMKIIFESKKYNANLRDDIYMQAFLKNACLRDSCYNCSFKNNYRNSDITLADYWGVKEIHPNLYDDLGTSAVIINSNKGQELFDKIKAQCVYEESNIENVIKHNPAYIKSAIKDKKYDEFFCNLEKKQFNVLVNKHVSKISITDKIKNKIKRILNIKRG